MKLAIIVLAALAAFVFLPMTASAAPGDPGIAGPCTPGDGSICAICDDQWNCWGVYQPNPHFEPCYPVGYRPVIWGIHGPCIPIHE